MIIIIFSEIYYLKKRILKHKSFEEFFFEYKELYLENRNKINLFEITPDDSNNYTKLQKMIKYKLSLNKVYILKSFYYLIYNIDELEHNKSMFTLTYMLLNNKNPEIFEIKNNKEFNKDIEFIKYIIYFIIKSFLKQSLVSNKAFYNNISLFINAIDKDSNSFELHESIIDYLKNTIDIIKVGQKFNYFISFWNLNKKFKKNYKWKFHIENEKKYNINDLNIFLLNTNLFKDEKKIDAGMFGNIYNYNDNIVKCNIHEVNNLNLIKESYITKILNDSCPDKIIKFYKLYYLINEDLMCIEIEKADYDLRDFYFNGYINNNKGKIDVINQIYESYECLRKLKFYHLDINYKNFVYFQESKKIKLIDFGLTNFEIDQSNNVPLFRFINNSIYFYNYLKDLMELFNLYLWFVHDIDFN